MTPIKLGVYRHYKGNLYEVVGFAKHSETLEDMVVYKAFYGEVDNFLASNRKKFLPRKGRISHDTAVKKAEDVYEQFRNRQDREYISQFDCQMGKYLKGNADE